MSRDHNPTEGCDPRPGASLGWGEAFTWGSHTKEWGTRACESFRGPLARGLRLAWPRLSQSYHPAAGLGYLGNEFQAFGAAGIPTSDEGGNVCPGGWPGI